MAIILTGHSVSSAARHEIPVLDIEKSVVEYNWNAR